MTETTQPTYTLDEARRKLNEQECARHGHAWDVVQTLSGPSGVVCGRCGRWHRVEKVPTVTVAAVETVTAALKAFGYIDVHPEPHYDEDYRQVAEVAVAALRSAGYVLAEPDATT